ncbi:NAD(P)-dependent oxidoreductase [Paludibacterium yongneupense]|uniref:NAD(P)-dependent oxidoreductase n=1 Tax=Paludibacterium yongneupense TaxID=400061 RepID=UPI0004182619|nr:NAD(P)-dependent oxidoreductase [Paludibacterium yongneupense]
MPSGGMEGEAAWSGGILSCPIRQIVAGAAARLCCGWRLGREKGEAMNGPCVLVLGDFEARWLTRLGDRYQLLRLGGDDVGRCEAVLLRSPYRIDAGLLATLPALRHIIRAGSGIGTGDLDAVCGRDIAVHSTPAAERSVAEHAFALLFAVARDIPYLHQQTMAGLWSKNPARGIELKGKHLVVVGFGRVGREIARIASAFGMSLTVVDPSPEKPEKMAALAALPESRVLALDEALPDADVLMLSCPGSPGQLELLDAQRIGRLPAGSILINVARGSLIDHGALEDALLSRRLAGVGLDVHRSESTGRQSWHLLPGVVVTPDIAAQTRETESRVGERVEALLDTVLGCRREAGAHA